MRKKRNFQIFRVWKFTGSVLDLLLTVSQLNTTASDFTVRWILSRYKGGYRLSASPAPVQNAIIEWIPSENQLKMSESNLNWFIEHWRLINHLFDSLWYKICRFWTSASKVSNFWKIMPYRKLFLTNFWTNFWCLSQIFRITES